MKVNNEINIEWLVCPVTKSPLRKEGGKLVSDFSSYSNEGGFWNFIPDKLETLNGPLWKVWSKLQENGMVSYENSPTNNLGVGPRKDYIAFGNFCEFQGVVLDIGVGPQVIPAHVEYVSDRNFTFIGVDPLVGQQPRKFPFIQSLGEYLPFKEKIFDQVVFATSLDHFIDPVVALLEAKRVLKDNGEICIWVGEKDKNAPKPVESPQWYKNLAIPEGAEDPFHFKRFNIDELYEYFNKAQLKIKVEEIIPVDQWRTNYFFKVSK